MLIDQYSESIVHVSCCHPRGTQLRQGRCPGGPEATGRRLVGSGGDGQERQTGLGAEQLSAAMLVREDEMYETLCTEGARFTLLSN